MKQLAEVMMETQKCEVTAHHHIPRSGTWEHRLYNKCTIQQQKSYLPAYIYNYIYIYLYIYIWDVLSKKKLKHNFHVTYVTTLEVSPDIGNNPSVGFLQISPLMLHPDSYRDDTWGPETRKRDKAPRGRRVFVGEKSLHQYMAWLISCIR